MVQSSSISITPSQHADNHRYGGSDPLTGDVRIDTPFTRADVTASRASGGIYQNTGNDPMFVMVVNTAGGAGQIDAHSDAATPPSIKVAGTYQSGVAAVDSITFVVMPNHYYEVNISSGGTITKWIEIS